MHQRLAGGFLALGVGHHIPEAAFAAELCAGCEADGALCCVQTHRTPKCTAHHADAGGACAAGVVFEQLLHAHHNGRVFHAVHQFIDHRQAAVGTQAGMAVAHLCIGAFCKVRQRTDHQQGVPGLLEHSQVVALHMHDGACAVGGQGGGGHQVRLAIPHKLAAVDAQFADARCSKAQGLKRLHLPVVLNVQPHFELVVDRVAGGDFAVAIGIEFIERMQAAQCGVDLGVVEQFVPVVDLAVAIVVQHQDGVVGADPVGFFGRAVVVNVHQHAMALRAGGHGNAAVVVPVQRDQACGLGAVVVKVARIAGQCVAGVGGKQLALLFGAQFGAFTGILQLPSAACWSIVCCIHSGTTAPATSAAVAKCCPMLPK
jgi:hypothetical protein